MEVQELLLLIPLTVKLSSPSAFGEKKSFEYSFFCRINGGKNKYVRQLVRSFFGHFKVGKHSLGSDASLLHGLKAKKVLACLSSLVQMVRGMVPRAS